MQSGTAKTVRAIIDGTLKADGFGRRRIAMRFCVRKEGCVANRIKTVELLAILTARARGCSFRRIGREFGVRWETEARHVRMAEAAWDDGWGVKRTKTGQTRPIDRRGKNSPIRLTEPSRHT